MIYTYLKSGMAGWLLLVILAGCAVGELTGLPEEKNANTKASPKAPEGQTATVSYLTKYHQGIAAVEATEQPQPPPPPCVANATRACGPCNAGTQTCEATGQWSDCKIASDVCQPGQQAACLRCGVKTCSAQCKWTGCDQPMCCDGDQLACDNGGSRTCFSGLFGACIGGATCQNGQQDNGETDKDCGGPNCGKCVIGQHCAANSDCTTNSCNSATKVCSYCGGSIKPKVLFVLDNSGSMNINNALYAVDGRTRWQVLVDTMRQVVTANRDRFDFGAIRFPATQDSSCSEYFYDWRTGQNITDGIGRIIVNFGADNIGNFLNASPYSGTFQQGDDTNWTPLLQILQKLPDRMSQMWSRISNGARYEKIYVVLISDGLHQCGPNILYRPDPTDQANLYQAARDLLDDNVKIYPVGFSSSRASDNGLDVLTLNRIAEVFDTRRSPGCVVDSVLSANSCTYDATSTVELTNSLSKILTDICK